jgi:aquaporin Z
MSGNLGIALAFGFAIVAMAYGIGPVSGCHVNPAVSLAAFVAGRMSAKEMVIYWAAQFARRDRRRRRAAVHRRKHAAHGLGQNGWGPGYGGGIRLSRRPSPSRW